MDILWHYLCSLTIKHTTSLKSVMLQSSSAAGGTAGVQPPVGLMEAVMEKIKQLSVRPLQAAARATGRRCSPLQLYSDWRLSGLRLRDDHRQIQTTSHDHVEDKHILAAGGTQSGMRGSTEGSTVEHALNGRVSSWSSAGGSPLWASRLPPPETRSLSISRSDRGSHSETCGTQDGRAVNSILANNTDMIFSFYLIKTPQNVQ